MKKIMVIIGIVLLQTALFAQIPTDSLVLYMPFNGNALDESGNGNNGITYGVTLTEDRFGNINSAYSFDGTGDYIKLPNVIPVFVGSISYWFKTNGSGENQVIVYHSNTNDNGFGTSLNYAIESHTAITLHDTDTYRNYYIFDNGTGIAAEDTLNNIVIGQWYNVVVTYDMQDSARMYVNGDLVNTLDLSTETGAKTPTLTYIGKPGLDVRYFNGVFDDFRVYSRILNPSEITSIYTENFCYKTIIYLDSVKVDAGMNKEISSDSLVAYWSFNMNADDLSGNVHHGIVNGPVLSKEGVRGGCFYFDGIDDYINLGNGWGNEVKSVSLWFKMEKDYSFADTLQVGLIFRNSGASTNQEFGLQFDPELWTYPGALNWNITQGKRVLTTDEITNCWSGNVWYHVAVSVDGSGNGALYINNKLVDLGTGVGLPASNSDTLFLGSWTKDVRFFKGYIDEVRIYNRSLEQSDIEALYRGTVSDIYYDTITVEGILRFYIKKDLINNPDASADILMYPNPTDEKLWIEIADYNELTNYQIRIVDAQSKAKWSTTIDQSSYSLYLSGFNTGLYFVIIYNEKGEKVDVKKLLVK